MRAITQDRYGLPEEVLALSDVDRPDVGDDEVLIRVAAASIHIGDYYIMRGVPYVLRPVFGLPRPKARIPGSDVAGRVEAVGKSVTRFAPGDEVFGWCTGAFAEHVAVPATQLAHRPTSLDSVQASTLVTSAITALEAIRDKGGVQAGQHVLINGAAGGVGTFAIQIAKALGAKVTAVCSTRNVELMRSIGADHVIDYTREDFTQGGPRYDLILDNMSNHSLGATRRALLPRGTLLSNGSPVGGWFGGLGSVIKVALVSMVVRQQGRPFVSLPRLEHLETLRDLVEAGKVRPVIDRMVPLEQAPEAMAHVGTRHARGKVVLLIGEGAALVPDPLGAG